jgi:hypothetical protein
VNDIPGEDSSLEKAPTSRRRFRSPFGTALNNYGRKRPVLGALVQAVLFTILFCGLLALRLHGERRMDLLPTGVISFGFFFLWMLMYHLRNHRRDRAATDGSTAS